MRIAIVVLPLMLAGCGIAAKVDARQNYQQSLAAYKECVAANGNNVNACEGKRVIMEADARAFDATSAGLRDNGGYSSGGLSNVIINTR